MTFNFSTADYTDKKKTLSSQLNNKQSYRDPPIVLLTRETTI